MDVKQSEIQRGDLLPITDRVYRHGLDTLVEEKEDKYVPKLRFFDLSNPVKKMDYSLSVDWERKTTPEETIIRVGCSYKTNTEIFKNYKNRIIYALEIKFINSLEWIIDTTYDPTLHEIKKLGSPDNSAHALINFAEDQYAQNRAAILTELRNHSQDKKIGFNMKEVDKAVIECRKLAT